MTFIDFSERMIAIARARNPDLDFSVDSCSEIASIEDGVFDLVIANYVLMDTPDLWGTMKAFNRVLKADGAAVLIFSHPCFPQGRATASENGTAITYTYIRWPSSCERPRVEGRQHVARLHNFSAPSSFARFRSKVPSGR